MRRLVCEFYDGFSFGRFVKRHPHLKGHLTDLLIGDLFKDERRRSGRADERDAGGVGSGAVSKEIRPARIVGSASTDAMDVFRVR